MPGLPANVSLPGLATRPVGSYVAGRSNSVDITLAKANVAVKLNGGTFAAGGGPAPDEIGSYGRIALYVGGMGARSKNFHKDVMIRRGFADAAGRIQELYLAGRKDEAAAAVPDEWVDLKSLVGPPAL